MLEVPNQDGLFPCCSLQKRICFRPFSQLLMICLKSGKLWPWTYHPISASLAQWYVSTLYSFFVSLSLFLFSFYKNTSHIVKAHSIQDDLILSDILITPAMILFPNKFTLMSTRGRIWTYILWRHDSIPNTTIRYVGNWRTVIRIRKHFA